MTDCKAICLLVLAAAAATLDAQSCAGLHFYNSNTLRAEEGDDVVTFIRDGDTPYSTSTIRRAPPYTASFPQVNGNQLLEGCFQANPPLVTPGASFQSGAGSQRATAIHSADSSNIGLAILFYSQPNTLSVFKVNPDLSIADPQNYTFSSFVNGVISADFNADGKPDLAVVGAADQSSGALWILINDGDTTFKAPVTYPTTGFAASVATGDFNQDGKLDLAVLNTLETSGQDAYVTIFFGNGNGTFRNAVSYPAGGYASSIVVGDVDGDGAADILIADTANEVIRKLAGNRDGTFTGFTTLLTATHPDYLAIGDFNNDGRGDVAWSDPSNDTIGLALSQGAGNFSAPQIFAAPYGVYSLIVTDVNQDGHMDLVVGTGTPELMGPDGNSGRIAVFMNNGDGTLQGPPAYPFAYGPAQIALADFDGDGVTDAAAGASSGASFSVLYGSGGGKFSPVSNFPVDGSAGGIVSVATADFNHDGKADLITAGYGGGVALALAKPGRTFQTSTLNLSKSAFAVAAGDFTGDGKPDAVIAFGPATSSTPLGLAVLPGDGQGGFGGPIPTNGLSASYLAAADLNKDQKLDLAVAIAPVSGQNFPGMTILIGKGDGTFRTGQTLFNNYAVASVTLADVDGDGVPDVLATLTDATFSPYVGVALGAGDGTFKTPFTYSTEFGGQSIAAADLNGDGVLDLAVGHCCGATDLTYLLGKGDGTFNSEKILAGEAYDVHAADLNGDGQADLVFSVQTGSQLEVLLSYPPAQGTLANVNGASFLDGPLSAESIATAFGNKLATMPVVSTELPLPTNQNGTTVTVKDSAGTSRQAPLFYVSAMQVNYEVPPGTANGIATVTITSPLGTSSGQVDIENLSPGFFEANAAIGLPVALVDLVTPDKTQTYSQVVQLDSNNNVVPLPIDLGTADDQVYITLYATGVRHASSLAHVSATIGGVPVQALYAGAQGTFVGFDQVNLPIPHSLAGSGSVDVQLTIDGVDAPPVAIFIH